MRLSLHATAGLLLTLASLPARASSDYPLEIRRVLTACATPQCTVCHNNPSGGVGSATRRFAMTMQRAGLTGGSNRTALRAALTRVQQQGTDSDRDTVVDILELEEGTDPSNATSLPGVNDAGCGVHTPVDGGTNGGSGGKGSGDAGMNAGMDAGAPGFPQDALTSESAEPPLYGCSASPAARGALLVLLLALLRVGAARRRRPHA